MAICLAEPDHSADPHALAVLGLTIPIIAILGLFSLTNGIRTLMGNTLARMNGLMVMRANSPAPVFSEVPESMA